MARFCPLASSSAGNSTYLGTASGAVLIDAGISCRQIGRSLETLGASLGDIHAVLITHEHTDHIKGLATLLKQTGAAVYATAPVLGYIEKSLRLPQGSDLREVTPGEEFGVGDISARAFSTPHDSLGSVGYRMSIGESQDFAVATDLGEVTEEVFSGVCGAQTVLIESNYDPFLLKMGPYPWHLKARIASEHGHLSNDASAEFASRLLSTGTSRLILGHLSKENNNPALARQTVGGVLTAGGAREGVDFELSVAPYDAPGKPVRL